MRYLANVLTSAALAACAAVAVAATPASALVANCAGPAIPGCSTSGGGHHSYAESRSMKSGGAAAHICTGLERSGIGFVAYECGYNTTFIRLCYWGPHISYGSHTGSSAAWTVDGRDATASDATWC